MGFIYCAKNVYQVLNRVRWKGRFSMAIKIFIVKGKLTGLNAHGEGGKILRVIRGKIRG